MTASPDFSPDNVRLTYEEIADLCDFQAKKPIGGLVVAANEALPAMGWTRGAPGEPDLIIPRGDSNQLVMHANHVGGLDQAYTDLAKIASYIALHEDLRSREHVVGLTYRQLASLAVRTAGFRIISPVLPDAAYVDRIRDAYSHRKISERQPFELAMIQMPVDELVDRFAIKRLGRDPQLLLSMVAWKTFVSKKDSTGEQGGDPTLPAIRRVIESMDDEPDA